MKKNRIRFAISILILAASIWVYQSAENSVTIEPNRLASIQKPEKKQNAPERTLASIPKKPAPKSSKTPNSKDPYGKLRQFLKSQGKGRWKLHLNSEGKFFRALGGEVPALDQSPEKITRFAHGVASSIGIPPEQLSSGITGQPTSRLGVHDLEQTFRGYPVYEGKIRVLTSRASGNGFLVYNQLFKINESEVQVPAAISEGEAEIILRDLEENEIQHFYRKTGPVVWAKDDRHQLAYVFDYMTTEDSLRVVIGAEDRDVLYRQSTVFK